MYFHKYKHVHILYDSVCENHSSIFYKKYTRFSVALCDTKFSSVSVQNSKCSNVNDLQNYHNPSDQFSHIYGKI